MKKICAIVMMLALLVAGPVFAVDTMALSSLSMSPAADGRGWGNSLLIGITITAAEAGTLTSRTIDETSIPARDLYNFWEVGYVIADAWLKNSATDDHDTAATVTITGELGNVLIGLGDGDDDTLTSLTTASGVARLVIARVSSQRAVTSKPTIAVSSTGDSATVKTLYLLLRK